MEDWIERLAMNSALIVESIAGAIIVVSALRAGYRTVLLGWIKRMGPAAGDPIRLDLGKSLALALEFLVGADVLRTAVSPDWDAVGKLASIVGIRSLLNYFLEKERGVLEFETGSALRGGGRKG